MKKGQIWIETVLYTLIALALIGVVLAFVMPKINNAQDRAVVEQSIAALEVFDSKVDSILKASGNSRNVDILIKRGEFYINSSSDQIVIVLADLVKPYSEPNIPIKRNRMSILSKKGQKTSRVYISLNYSGVANITYDFKNIDKKFNQAPTPYRFNIANEGPGVESNIDVINIVEISGR